MRTWDRIQETAARSASRDEPGRSTAQAVAYVTISREAGAEGAAVAQLVGERLGWEVYDTNLLDQVAQRNQESRLMLDLVDETESNWVYDVLGTWMDRQIIPHEKYVAQVSRMIQVLARKGKAVFVGRGAQFLLPRSKVLAVRIVAPEAFRAERVRQRRNVALAEALAWIRRTDRGRRDFIQRFFRQDIRDPHLYDLVLNAERLGLAGAADQIVRAVRGAAG
jgi:cytidylate kinase